MDRYQDEQEDYKAQREAELPLFRRPDGTVICTRDIYKLVKVTTAGLGLDPQLYGAHSLRIGGATAALACASGSEYTVKVLGYWASQAVASYTRPTKEMMLQLVTEMLQKRKTDVLE